MASNGEWGEAQETTKAQKIYETFESYPELQLTPALQTFLDSKGLRFEDLEKLGVRQTLSGDGELTLVYWFPDGLKFRTLSGIRWADKGTEWNLARRVKSAVPDTTNALVVEGETDGALMARVMPTYDVFILPAGARYVSDAIIAQLKPYASVLVGLDNDEAGAAGAEKILKSLSTAAKIVPPAGANDWCEAAVKGALVGWKPEPTRLKVVFSFGEIIDTDFGSFNDNNWFEDPILPVGGQLMIHAPKKSLKSFIVLDLVRAITTGTAFAGSYNYVYSDGPGKVLLVQMEIPPLFFQLRLLSWLRSLSGAEQELFRINAHALGIGNNRLPRLKITHKDFRSQIYRAIEEAEAQVVVFDPIQRITGEGNLDKTNEMDALLDFFAELQGHGITVVACHHNSKASGESSKDPNAMVGTQRFSGDADSICSVWHDKTCMVGDSSPDGVKERNFTWTLRNGSAPGRSIRTKPDAVDPYLIEAEFGPEITLEVGGPSIV